MRLEGASIALVELPFRRPFCTAKGTWHVRQVVVLRLQAACHFGFGEAAPLPSFSWESIEQARRGVEGLVESLRREPELPSSVGEVESWMGGQEAVPSAKMAVEVALLDLIARSKGVPLAQILGASEGMGVAVNATIGSGSVAQAGEAARAFLEGGFECFKVKVGAGELAKDVERVATIREVIGEASTLRLDANGAWGRAEASEALAKLSAYDVSLVEQPMEDLIAFGARPVRVAADESIRSLEDAVQHLPHVDVLVLKPMLLGGLLPSLRIQERALTQGVSTIYTTLLDGAIARAAVTHLAAASKELEGPCGLATGGLFEHDYSGRPLVPERGYIEIPSLAGLGVVPDGVEAFVSLFHGAAQGVLRVPHPVAHRARYVGDRVAVRHEDGSEQSYHELMVACERAAFYLRERVGGELPPRVAVYLENVPQLVSWVHALGMLGVTLVAVHPKTPREDALARMRQAGVELVLGEGQVLGEMDVIDVTKVGLDSGEREDLSWSEVAFDEVAALLFTSGTTGEPKMVPIRWQQVLLSATGSAVALGHQQEDVWLLNLPLCHVGGLSIVWRCALLGTTLFFASGFDASRVADWIHEGRVTQWSAVSRMMSQVLEHLGAREASAKFRVALLGGGPVPGELTRRSQERGIKVAVTYGMTEGASQLTTAYPARADGTAGVPLIWGWLRVGKESAIEVRGGTMMSGYVGQQGLGEWFETGDLGVWEEGSLRMLDRRTDLIVTGGENVYPAEVEGVLREHPKVTDVCVVGLSDDEWGQSVVAVLEGKATAVPISEVEAFARKKLARFKVPSRWYVQEKLERSSLGKVSRGRVKEALQKRIHHEVGGI